GRDDVRSRGRVRCHLRADTDGPGAVTLTAAAADALYLLAVAGLAEEGGADPGDLVASLRPAPLDVDVALGAEVAEDQAELVGGEGGPLEELRLAAAGLVAGEGLQDDQIAAGDVGAPADHRRAHVAEAEAEIDQRIAVDVEVDAVAVAAR